MEDKLRRYIDGLFARTAHTKKAVELKEEMLQNMQDKYDDLIAEGKTPEAAYNIVIAGVGDVGGLLYELDADAPDTDEMIEYETGRRVSAMLTAIAVMGYILSFLPLMILGIFGSAFATRIGVPLMFLMIAASTGLLVYNGMTKPKGYKRSDSIVEEFREWQADSHDRKALRRAISSAFWAILISLYFIISFWTSAWHLTWILFLLGAAVEAIINLLFTVKK